MTIAPVKIIRKKTVSNMVGLGISTMYAWMSEGKFPKSISLGGNAVGWVESEIIEWIEQRIEERDLHQVSTTTNEVSK